VDRPLQCASPLRGTPTDHAVGLIPYRAVVSSPPITRPGSSGGCGSTRVSQHPDPHGRG